MKCAVRSTCSFIPSLRCSRLSRCHSGPPPFIQLTTHFDCSNGRAGQRARQYESQSENNREREKERVMEKQLAGGDRRETVPEDKWKTLFP